MPLLLVAVLLFGALPHVEAQAVWENGVNYRRSKAQFNRDGKPGFTLLGTAQTAVTFSNVLTLDRACTNSILANGSGVALGDVDGDGRCDIYFASLDGRNALYRNKGDWKFEDITRAAGVACEGVICTGVALADIDGDGDLDLLVNALFRGTTIFLNDGQGHFSNATEKLGLLSSAPSTSFALGDIDGDGDLDLYVANYRNTTVRDEPGTQFEIKREGQNAWIRSVNGVIATNSALRNRFVFDAIEGAVENGEPDILYLNENGRFQSVPWTDGRFLDEDGRPIAEPRDWGLSVMIRDLNGDGLPDIYVCNDFLSPDRIWINQGKGTFKALSTAAIRDTSRFSMGVDVADINRDGHDDIFALDMLSRDHGTRHQQIPVRKREAEEADAGARAQHSRNTLHLNRGDGTYAEIAYLSGLAASEWSWTPVFLDVDLDGFEDLLISNGFIYDGQNIDVGNEAENLLKTRKLGRFEYLGLRRKFPKLDAVSCVFRNRGNLTFEDCSTAWKFNFKGVSQGMAIGDLDNDGDLDVVLNTLNGPALVYRNETGASRIGVRLKGKGKNSRGIGARIEVTGGPVAQSQEMICGGRYLSCDDAIRTFAAGSDTNLLRVRVGWRNGNETVVDRAVPGWIYEILEENSTDSLPPQKKAPIPLFTDATTALNHRHYETFFDDFAAQPLLGRKLSQSGPGVAILGNSAFAVGGPRGGKIALFSPDPKSGFAKREIDPVLKGDTQGMICVAEGEGVRLITALSSWEQDTQPSLLEILINQAAVLVRTNFPKLPSSLGPLAAADIDGDGTLDLFAGGRVTPRRYPEPCSSFILRNEPDRWVLDAKASQPFENVGMVTGAVFLDINGDGSPDLALACDWGPVRMFVNAHGTFREETHEWGLSDFRGWWNGIAAGDFDGDGRMDLVAANWGRNTKYQPHLADELRIYYGEWQVAGRMDLIEAYFDPAQRKVVPSPGYSRAIQSLPFLATRFPTAASYASASVEELLNDKLRVTRELRINTLDSMVFLNRGDHFEAKPLPIEAQFSPAFGLSIADFDGDGVEDIFLAQNFFGTDAETGRYASGRGLVLSGDGRGGFMAMPAQESGIAAYGEQRGCATGDLNADGRPDLILGQNNRATRLFINASGKPGLRVRVEGESRNVRAVGATLRGIYRANGAVTSGSAHEIHAGSGYFSQDGPIQIFGNRANLEGIWVRWPGGKTNLFNVPSTAKEIVLRSNGTSDSKE